MSAPVERYFSNDLVLQQLASLDAAAIDALKDRLRGGISDAIDYTVVNHESCTYEYPGGELIYMSTAVCGFVSGATFSKTDNTISRVWRGV